MCTEIIVQRIQSVYKLYINVFILFSFKYKKYINMNTKNIHEYAMSDGVTIMSDDIMVRVPRELRSRFEKLILCSSWKGFPSFVRDAVRDYLERYEEKEINR
jgi:hypothetical protein